MHSPFIVHQDFLSPAVCERIVSEIKLNKFDEDDNGWPVKHESFHSKWGTDISLELSALGDAITTRYGGDILSFGEPTFIQYPEKPHAAAEVPGCENSVHVRKKWVMVKDIDLVGYIFLKDFNDQVPLDPEYEVYGGKLEFPLYGFSITPQRGTLVMYPAGPHFIRAISPVFCGSLEVVKVTVTMRQNGSQWLYQPDKFTGRWQEWFNEYV